jgi:DNA-binding GntR family transcriptional regulator
MTSEKRKVSLVRPIHTPQRLTDVVHAQLRDAVLNRELRAGQPLSVPSLARRLKVSRSPVREAVLQLVADGLATNEPRKGAVVSVLNDADLLVLHDIREVLEGLAARRAAARMTGAMLERMKAVLGRQREGVRRKDPKAYVETDLEFHGALYAAAEAPRLRRLLEALTDQMRLSVSISLVDPDHQRLGLSEHEAVLQALRKRDEASAEKLVRQHLRNARERVAATLQRLARAQGRNANGKGMTRPGPRRPGSRLASKRRKARK